MAVMARRWTDEGRTRVTNSAPCARTTSASSTRRPPSSLGPAARQIDGQDMSQLSDSQRAQLRATKIGLVLQSGNLVPFLTAAENVALALRFGVSAASLQEAIETLSTKIGLVLLVLGFMHFFNLGVFTLCRNRALRTKAPIGGALPTTLPGTKMVGV